MSRGQYKVAKTPSVRALTASRKANDTRIIPCQVNHVAGLELEPHQVILTHKTQEEQPAAHVLMFGLLTPREIKDNDVHGHSNSRTVQDPQRHSQGSK